MALASLSFLVHSYGSLIGLCIYPLKWHCEIFHYFFVKTHTIRDACLLTYKIIFNNGVMWKPIPSSCEHINGWQWNINIWKLFLPWSLKPFCCKLIVCLPTGTYEFLSFPQLILLKVSTLFGRSWTAAWSWNFQNQMM